MKRTLVLITTVILLAVTPAPAGWFDDEEKQRLAEAQQQLDQERQRSGGLEIIVGVLALGAVTLLIIGTALGSKTRRDGQRQS